MAGFICAEPIRKFAHEKQAVTSTISSRAETDRGSEGKEMENLIKMFFLNTILDFHNNVTFHKTKLTL